MPAHLESLQDMDPDCAICSSPSNANCGCEAKGLEIAVRQAEARMMTTFFSDIRCVDSEFLPSLNPYTHLRGSHV